MDPVQVLGSFAAIVITALLAWRMFPARTPLNDQIVRRNIARYAPEARIASTFLSKNAKAAVASLTSPALGVGLAVRLGDRVVCRILQAADIKNVRTSGDTLVLTFDDFTQPSIKLDFDPSTLAEVSALFDELTSNDKDLSDAA